MMAFPLSSARRVLRKPRPDAMDDDALEAWAGTKNLGAETQALTTGILYARAMLNTARGREIDNPDLDALLLKLRMLAYDADDVLDYFRVKDGLDAHAEGCVVVHGLLLRVRRAASAVAAKLIKRSSPPNTAGNEWKVQTAQTITKLKFDRVALSTKMKDILQKLKTLCAMVSTVLTLELLAPRGITTTTMERPMASKDGS